MLKRERYYVLDPFKWIGRIIASKALCNHDFDTTEIVPRAPVTLGEEFVMECWKLQLLKLAMFI
jgi:hypothetical protein